MKLFHLADLHLGKSIYEHDLVPDQNHVLQQIADLANEQQPACVVLAGDIFDRAVPPPEAVSLLGNFLARLKRENPQLLIAIIPGNHDSPARLAYLSGVLDQAGVHIRSDLARCTEAVVVEQHGQKARLWLVPFLSPGALPHADADGSAPPRTQADLFAAVMNMIEAAMQEARAADKRAGLKRASDVLVCHAFAAGGRSGDSERAFLGTAELVDMSLCANFDYVALGHLHRPQAAGSNGHYAGSLLAYSFADADCARGFMAVDCMPDSCSATLVEISPLRRMIRLRAAFEDLLHDEKYSVHENDYIEAVLEDADRVLNPMDPLRRRFPYLLSLGQASIARGATSTQQDTQTDAGAPVDIMDEYREFFRAMFGASPQADDEALFAQLLQAARERQREGGVV